VYFSDIEAFGSASVYTPCDVMMRYEVVANVKSSKVAQKTSRNMKQNSGYPSNSAHTRRTRQHACDARGANSWLFDHRRPIMLASH